MSGGQRHGVLLARMLLREPRVLLLDEPTTAMDELAERDVIARLRQLPTEHTLIIATHRMGALDAVERVILVDGGTIVMDGPKEQVLATLRGDPQPTPPSAPVKTRLVVPSISRKQGEQA